MNDFERAKAVNDHVVLLATYTEQGATEGQTVYELIQDGTAVCQAYALLAYRLFLAAGLMLTTYMAIVTTNCMPGI